jgi:hypothetical protein
MLSWAGVGITTCFDKNFGGRRGKNRVLHAEVHATSIADAVRNFGETVAFSESPQQSLSSLLMA